MRADLEPALLVPPHMMLWEQKAGRGPGRRARRWVWAFLWKGWAQQRLCPQPSAYWLCGLG